MNLDTTEYNAEREKLDIKCARRGSGPIVLGQACEDLTTGSQSLRSLQKKGIETMLIQICHHRDGPSMADPLLYHSRLKSLQKILEEHPQIDAATNN
jgi:carbamoylphosphate synthase large subunit